MSSRILVTGATGLIGRGILKELNDYSNLLYTARNPSNLNLDRFVPFDLKQVDEIYQFLDRISPQIIIHTAAITSIEDVANNFHYAYTVNVEAAARIAEWCENNGARLVHFSSDFVFDGTKQDYTETDDPFPLSSYGKTKLESERSVQKILKNHVIIRPILVFGYFEGMPRLNLPLLIKSKLEQGERMNITSDQFRMPTHVSTVAKLAVELAFSEYTGLLHVCGKEFLSVYDFALIVAKVFSLDSSLLIPVSTIHSSKSECRPMVSGFNCERARRLFDFHPVPIEIALQSLLDKDRL